VLARDAYTCYRCGGYADQVDHLTPMSKGGTSTLDNLRACCRTCNLRKMHEDNPHLAWGRQSGVPPVRSAPTGALVELGIVHSAEHVRAQRPAVFSEGDRRPVTLVAPILARTFWVAGGRREPAELGR
jgi:hypothetical protein